MDLSLTIDIGDGCDRSRYSDRVWQVMLSHPLTITTFPIPYTTFTTPFFTSVASENAKSCAKYVII